MTKSTTRQAADVAHVVGRKNLIINGDMRVSQRGNFTTSASFSNGSYYHDRWVATNGVGANLQELSTSQPNNQSGKSVRVTTTSSGTAQCTLEQRFESPQWLKGRTVKLSAWVKSNSSNCALNIYHGSTGFTTPVSHSGGGAWEKLEMAYTFSGTETSDFRVRIGLSQGGNTSITSGDYFEFTEVQLELGSVATDFEHRSYGEELALCQRYYEVIGDPTNSYSIAGITDAGATFSYTWPTKAHTTIMVPKRVVPTITKLIHSSGGLSYYTYVTESLITIQTGGSSGHEYIAMYTADAEL